MIVLLVCCSLQFVLAVQHRPVESFMASLEEHVPYLTPESFVDNELFFDRASPADDGSAASLSLKPGPPPPYCSNSLCGKNSTCCIVDDKPTCFSGVNDTCCGLSGGAVCVGIDRCCCCCCCCFLLKGIVDAGVEACPANYLCDPIAKDCVKNSNSTICQACETIVKTLIDEGCSYACDALPPIVDAVCEFIVDEADLCDRILNWTTHGVSPFSVCAEIGLCTGSNCKCG